MDNQELISAALDGEHVDLAALQAALEEPSGQAALASFVLLRAAVAGDDDRPGEGFYDAVAPVVRTRARVWALRGPRVPLAVAASLVLLAMAGSFLAGARSQPQELHAFRVVQTTANPAPQAQPSAGADLPPRNGVRWPLSAETRPAEPPKPARLLHFRPGIDWRDGSSN